MVLFLMTALGSYLCLDGGQFRGNGASGTDQCVPTGCEMVTSDLIHDGINLGGNIRRGEVLSGMWWFECAWPMGSSIIRGCSLLWRRCTLVTRKCYTVEAGLRGLMYMLKSGQCDTVFCCC